MLHCEWGRFSVVFAAAGGGGVARVCGGND